MTATVKYHTEVYVPIYLLPWPRQSLCSLVVGPKHTSLRDYIQAEDPGSDVSMLALCFLMNLHFDTIKPFDSWGLALRVSILIVPVQE